MSGTKTPTQRIPRIAIIGAGPGGLCMAVRLKQSGFDDFVLLEKSDGVGGTWRHNRYPGWRWCMSWCMNRNAAASPHSQDLHQAPIA